MRHTDKVLHALVGVTLAVILSQFSFTLAIVGVVVAGIGKEVWDYYNKGTVDGWDAVATIVPGFLVVFLQGVII